MRFAPLVLLACSTAPPPVAALEAVGSTPCAADADCLVSHNECEPTGACSHADDVPVTPDVVCDPPRFMTPDADACVCSDAGTCTVIEP